MTDWILENKPEYDVVGIDNLFGGYKENVDERCILYIRDLMVLMILNDIKYVDKYKNKGRIFNNTLKLKQL